MIAILAAAVMTVTAYCNEGPHGCRICNGKWAALNRTASGARPVPGITIAASRNIPFGTRLQIQGLGVRVVQDRLARRFDDRIDVYMSSHREALRFGKRQLNVEFVR